MDSKEWTNRICTLDSKESVRFAMAVIAFSDTGIEWEARRTMMAEALGVTEGSIDQAVSDMKSIGLFTEIWTQ